MKQKFTTIALWIISGFSVFALTIPSPTISRGKPAFIYRDNTPYLIERDFIGVAAGNSGTTTLNPTDDTDTQSDVATGVNPVLQLSQWSNPILKFNLSSISGAVSAAKLRLYLPNGTLACLLTVKTTTSDTWTEGSTKPGAGTVVTTQSVASSSTGKYVEVDLTTHVQNKMTGNKIVSLFLSNDLGTWTSMNSRQSSTNKPELVVTTSVSNTPPTVSLTAPTSGTTVTAPGTITLAANAGDSDGTVAKVEFYNGTTLLGNDATAPYSFTWTSVAAGTYSLTAKAIDNVGASSISVAASITVVGSSSTRIEAENWSAMQGVQTETTTDTGGGLNVGYIDNGDWMEYAINFPAAGSYTIAMRVAGNGGQCQIKDGSAILSTVTIPATGGWQKWTTTTTTINVAAGQRTIKFVSSNATNWNINYFEYSPGPMSTTYAINITASNGTVSKNPTKTAYNAGEVVTLTATPNSGFVFTNWTGDVTGSTNPITVTMNANKNISANFSARTFTLTTTATNGVIVKNPDKASYNAGEVVTITAVPNSGFTFSNWSGDVSGFVNPTTITMNGNKTITANFSTNQGGATLLDPNATQETKNLWNYLNQIYGQKVISGINEQSGSDDIKSTSGKTPAIVGEDMYGFLPRNTVDWGNTLDYFSGNLINHYNNGGIVTVQWHWGNPFDYSKDAWSDITSTQWNNMFTTGTSENTLLNTDIDLHVNRFLKKLVDKNGKPIPILFRPLHEIDGGWFWWTNESNPAKTVQLYKYVQDRIMNFHQMHNLIWIWNNAESENVTTVASYYPGNNFVDLVGVDLYYMDYQNTGKNVNTQSSYKDYYNVLGQVAPGKMRALCEGDALPNPVKTQNNDPAFVKWLYVLSWWATSDGSRDGFCVTSPCNPASWVNTSYNHDVYITLDELATNGSHPASTTARVASSSARTTEKDNVTNASHESSVRVFPNPAEQGNLNISINGFSPNEKITVEIVPANGSSIYNQVLNTTEQGNLDIQVKDSEQFVRGIYVLKVKGQSKRFVSKFIIQ